MNVRPGLIGYVGGATCVAAGVVKIMFGTHWLLGAVLMVAGGAVLVMTTVASWRRAAANA